GGVRGVQGVRGAGRRGLPLRVALLLVGESGTGKHWLARTVHHQGLQREGTFVALDCARLPPALLAAILFGDAGLARSPGVGTYYLQEPAQLPGDLQERLGQLLEAAAPDPGSEARRPRLTAGCSPDPAAAVRAGRLLEGLFCQLGVLTIALPPLRERLADLPFLVERFLARTDEPSRVKGLTPAAWDVLRGYRWPGNLRELNAVLASARERAAGERLDAADVAPYLPVPDPLPARP